ncbi:uncharacterized protein [Dermacentor andersoni]|uniref:uncharacterized protein n=1 Tax=Dermacentor andersoni TaxID=34620 RepID=UPI0024168CA7|nr:uncharacterized protein LOC129380343 [Dermacentor andersoni]
MSANDLPTLSVLVDGVQTQVTPVVDGDGRRVPFGDGFAYRTPDGTVITVIFQECETNTSSAMEATPADLSVAPMEERSRSPEDELWSVRRTRFLILKYKELNPLVGKKGGLKTKKAMWQEIARMINTEFSVVITELQVQNKWKSLERSYKKTKIKNNSSGHSTALCEYEEELSDVLEKEHHITPTVLMKPGGTIEKDSSMSPGADDGTDMEPELSTGKPLTRPASAAGVNAHPKGALRRKKDSTSLNALLREFKEAKEERAERFDRKMALLERLVTAVEKVATTAPE